MAQKDTLDFIRENDPEYDPIPDALAKAGVAPELFKAAKDRVYCDGYYGPISAAEWEEQDGRPPFRVPEARAIIAKVLDEVGDYIIEDYDYCSPDGARPECMDQDDDEAPVNCDGHLAESGRYDAGDIKAALVPWYREIYGQRFPTP